MIPSPNKTDDNRPKLAAGDENPKRRGLFDTPAWIGSGDAAFGTLGFLLLMGFATVLGTQQMPMSVLCLRFLFNFVILIFWTCWLHQILRKAGPGRLERILKALNGWILLGYLWMSFFAAGTCAVAVEIIRRLNKP